MHRTLRGIRIVFEDDSVIVVEKYSGILVQQLRQGRAYTVEGALTDYVRKGQSRSRKRVYLVHRLDRETSGVMLVAKTPEAEDFFRTHWNETTEKTYLARVQGVLPTSEGVYESYLAEDADGYRVRSVSNPKHGKLARTEWRVESVVAGTSLVRVALKSGRKNQIRVHFAEQGFPVLGDVKYHGPKASRLCLHAWRLAFIHPVTGKRLFFETARPAFATEEK